MAASIAGAAAFRPARSPSKKRKLGDEGCLSVLTQ